MTDLHPILYPLIADIERARSNAATTGEEEAMLLRVLELAFQKGVNHGLDQAVKLLGRP